MGSPSLTASRGTRLTADTGLNKALSNEFDMIVLPGGLPSAEYLNNDPRIHSLLKRVYAEDGAIAAICGPPMVLAQSGLATGKPSLANQVQSMLKTGLILLLLMNAGLPQEALGQRWTLLKV